MSIRRAPATGYDFGSKRQYRRNVWAAFRKLCVGRLRGAQALLMPSSEGDEIDVALSVGFHESNLHVVDRNPAIVAHLKRRFPKVNTYGVELPAAIDRMSRAGVRLAVANFDLCGPVSRPLCQMLQSLADADAMSCAPIVAVTVLRGREDSASLNVALLRGVGPEWRSSVTDFFPAMGLRVPYGDSLDTERLACIRAALCSAHNRSFPARWGSYKSSAGTQTMLWSVWYLLNTSALQTIEAEEQPNGFAAFIGKVDSLAYKEREA